MDKQEEKSRRQLQEEQKQRAENEAKNIKASWERIKGEPAFEKFLSYLTAKQAASIEVAMDGAGLDPMTNALFRLTKGDRDMRLMEAKVTREILAYLKRVTG